MLAFCSLKFYVRYLIKVLPRCSLQVTKENLLPEVSILPSLVGISPVKVEIQFFYKLPRDLTLVTWSKNFVALRVGASHSKSAPSLVWCPWIFYKWKCNLFYLPRGLTRPPHRGVIRIYWWGLPAVCYDPDKFGDHRYCDSG